MIPELRQLYSDGRLIPFIGAGVSMSVSWTRDGVERRGLSWSELVNRASEMLGFSDPALLRARGTDLQILEYFRLVNGGMARLTNWLYAETQPPNTALQASTIHQELAAMERCGVYYTTNYDDFLEKGLRLNGRPCRVVATESDLSVVNPGCEVVKFHGDFSFPDQMVLSESHYEDRLNLNSVMDLRLQADMLGRALLFLGYSFRDPNVSYLFSLVHRRFRGLPGTPSGRRAYIAVPEPSKFELQLFRERNIDVLPLDRGRITEQTAALLRDIRG
jgi:hypothetical protein